MRQSQNGGGEVRKIMRDESVIGLDVVTRAGRAHGWCRNVSCPRSDARVRALAFSREYVRTHGKVPSSLCSETKQTCMRNVKPSREPSELRFFTFVSTCDVSKTGQV